MFGPRPMRGSDGSGAGGDKEGSAVRMAELRCLLNRRGIAAAPLNNSHARAAPPGPGACLLQ
eukprot:527457-Rhodomonas_salina.3